MNRSADNRASIGRLLRPIILIFVLLLLIWTGRIVISVLRLQNDLRALQGTEQVAAMLMASPQATEEIGGLANRSLQDIQELRGALGPTINLLPALGWLPQYGGDLQNAPALLDFAEKVLLGAQDTLSIGRAIGAEMERGRASNAPIGTSLLHAATLQKSVIQRAQKTIDAVRQIRAQIDLTQLSPSTQNMLAKFDRWLPLWQVALDVLTDAPSILGAERPRSYLLIAQNSDELRATGGFISGVALLRVDQGNISIVEFHDSFAVDDLDKPHPAPPDPLWRYMYAGQWVFRDANWSPDFPTSARQLQAIYRIDRNKEVDGVIAINQQILPDLIQAIGPVTLDVYNERIDATNVMSKIHEYWALPQSPGRSSDWWEHRKDFLGKLLQAMIQRMIVGEIDRAQLGRAMLQAIETKNLLAYINDLPPLSQPGALLGGSVYEGTSDLLMLVDSNVGFNKVDSSVSRQVGYAVTMEAAGTLRASVAITYTNLSPRVEAFCVNLPNYQFTYADLQQGCYWDYVRVVVPAGSELIRAVGALDPKTETTDKGYTVFAGYFVLPQADTQVIRFDYRLPATIHTGSRYHLVLQKQSGASTAPVRVRLHVPAGSTISAYPHPDRVTNDTAEFEMLWDRDAQIQVNLQQSSSMEAVGMFLIVGVVVLATISILFKWRSA